MKAIQTNFRYKINGENCNGSYLGRKTATLNTLKRFTNKNSNGREDCKAKDIFIEDSFVSNYQAS